MSFSSTSTVPIEMLPGIGRRTAKVLRSMHVLTVGQFKTVPEKLLVEVFGPSILSLYSIVSPKISRGDVPDKKISRITQSHQKSDRVDNRVYHYHDRNTPSQFGRSNQVSQPWLLKWFGLNQKVAR